MSIKSMPECAELNVIDDIGDAHGGAKIQGLSRGDFLDLVKPFINSMWAVAFRLSGDRRGAEELVRQSCSIAFAGYSELRQGADFKPWLFRMLLDACRDQLQRESRGQRHSVDGAIALSARGIVRHKRESSKSNQGFGQPPEIITTPDNSCSRSSTALSAALRELSIESQILLVLSTTQGVSYDDIARILDCPCGVVRARVSSFRQQLFQRISECQKTDRSG